MVGNLRKIFQSESALISGLLDSLENRRIIQLPAKKLAATRYTPAAWKWPIHSILASIVAITLPSMICM